MGTQSSLYLFPLVSEDLGVDSTHELVLSFFPPEVRANRSLQTLASLLEARITDDPELCGAAIHALNRWMADEWPFTFEGRIYSTPVISPGLVEQAISELEWAVEHGAKAVLMRPSPAWGY